MKSWADTNVVVVVIVAVVEVTIRIDIPHVVIVVSRAKPNSKRRYKTHGITYIIFPYIIYIK